MAVCKSCGAEIRWEKTENDKNVPISVATGESHFKDCPQAKQWTKKKSG